MALFRVTNQNVEQRNEARSLRNGPSVMVKVKISTEGSIQGTVCSRPMASKLFLTNNETEVAYICIVSIWLHSFILHLFIEYTLHEILC